MPSRRKFISQAVQTFALAVAGGSLLSSDMSAFAAPNSNRSLSVDADRWLEIDLYWFEKDHIRESASEFLQRVAPLYAGLSGWRGVILNVGWLIDYIAEWNGDLNQSIPLLRGANQQPWSKVEGLLTGDTTERMRQWRERFAHPVMELKRDYQAWTYGDLKTLAKELRTIAERRYGIKGLLVGSLVVDWRSIYGSQPHIFGTEHPEVYRTGTIDYTATLHSDTRRYAAFPTGIPEGVPIGDFFGSQWGHLSKSVGLNAIVLRDSFLFKGVYTRGYGPQGAVPTDPVAAARWSGAVAAFVRATKLGNPKALVIAYSNAASAISDWRVNCVDFEALASEGYLDAFIDQTWAGAWNEVGVRDGDFWNAPILGWTFQLATVLIHAAVLAKTRVRHYVLTETFDAWESWDIIHTAPERLRWGIWAYHHAAVKMPTGLRMPRGTYVSWMNQGKRLLSDKDVTWLTTNLNGAIKDARKTSEVYGPTLVYCRDAIKWEMEHAPAIFEKEWIDEQAGCLIKWGVPILSVTRSEWLGEVKTDMPILSIPDHLPEAQVRVIERIIHEGRPLAIFGSPAGGVDRRLSKLCGIATSDAHPLEAMAVDARWCAANDSVPQWWQVDLEKPIPVNRIVIRWEFDGKTYDYRIDGSLDGASWRLLADRTNNADISQIQAMNIVAEPVRYIRITVTRLPDPGVWASIRTVHVYGEGAGDKDLALHRPATASSSQTQLGHTPNQPVSGDGDGLIGHPSDVKGGLTDGVPNSFPVFQEFSRNRALPGAQVIYKVNDSPCLVMRRSMRQRTLFWDPAELRLGARGPLINYLVSVYPYVMTARAMSVLLEGGECPYVREIPPYDTVAIGAWRRNDDVLMVLAGNTEEGLKEKEGPDYSRRVELTLPKEWMPRNTKARNEWSERIVRKEGGCLLVELGQEASALYEIR